MMWRKLAYGLLLTIVMAPLLSFAAWYFSTKKQYTVAIVDKTVLNTEGQEHSSLHWVLNHNRFVKTADSRYQIDRDYFGFFPKEDTLYDLKGLERFSSEGLNALSDDADLTFSGATLTATTGSFGRIEVSDRVVGRLVDNVGFERTKSLHNHLPLPIYSHCTSYKATRP